MPHAQNTGNTGDRCPIKDCPRTRGVDKLLCYPHWLKVPRVLQQEVYRTWRERQAAVGQGVGDVYSRAREAHEKAKGQAIRAVEAKERRDDENGSQMYLDRHPEVADMLEESE